MALAQSPTLRSLTATAARRSSHLRKNLESEEDCVSLVDKFCDEAGGIDGLVHLSGALNFSGHWKNMPAADWRQDMNINLDQPFFPGAGRHGEDAFQRIRWTDCT